MTTVRNLFERELAAVRKDFPLYPVDKQVRIARDRLSQLVDMAAEQHLGRREELLSLWDGRHFGEDGG